MQDRRGIRIAERRSRRVEDRALWLDRSDPLAHHDRHEMLCPAVGVGVSVNRRRERPVRQDRQGPIACQPGEHRGDARSLRQAVDEGHAVHADRPADDLGVRVGRGVRLDPPLLGRRDGHPRHSGEHPNQSLLEVDLSELRDLLAELPLALLGPGREKRVTVDVRHAFDDPVRHDGDDAAEAVAIDRDQGVPEVEGDRGDPIEWRRHGATLDGQIALNGQ